jgi:predicted ATPase/DNA-binding SARP family transcriptional activator
MTLEFGVLGPLMVWSDGEAVAITGAKRRGLLAYLLVHAGEPQPLDRIVDALWVGSPSRGAESTVQTYVSQLRKLFAGDGVQLLHRAGGYVVDLDAGALDAARFEAAVSAATTVEDRDQRLWLLDDALALWRGAPLDEFAGQAWADERARQWTRLHVLAHQLRVAALLDAGRHRDTLPTLEQLVAAHPLHEPFWAQLVVARYRCGQQADALAAASEARRILATELGIDPGPELVELENKVLAQDPALDAPVHEEPTSSDVVRAVTLVEPLPDGVVTFLLTDIEGSTALWDQRPEPMAKAIVRHEDVISDVVQAHNGRLLKSRGEGDATLSVFPKATDAVTAAVALQRRLQTEPWPGGLVLATRVALHTGEAHLRDGDYYGGTLNRAARLRGLAVGGQVLVSRAVHDLVVDVLAPELELVGFGEHTMKGLQRAENVYAIAGPGLDAEARERREKVIARPHTSFIGRTDVIDEVERALRDSGVVTLLGPGGIGKTRLALETTVRVRDQFDTVHVVQLAHVSDPDAVISEIANTIGVGASADAIEAIALAVGRDRTLIVIDNCEHLIDACARIIDDLANESPALTVLTTSRVPLELHGETIIDVEPLAEDDAVRLLLDRAGRRGPEPRSAERASMHDIARHLDGIPLALELTAARLRSMSATDLVARLPVLDAAARRPATLRHATMRAALDWSYGLLSEQEQALLRRLSVFAGFTIEAAEHVVPRTDGDALVGRGEVADLVRQLVTHSLVVFDQEHGRYRLLEPVRQYAADLLQLHGDVDETRARHAQYFAAVADRVARAMVTGQQSRTDLDDDEANIEAALTWADDRNDDETLCRIVAALGFFWYSTNAPQGRRWTRRVVGRRRDVSAALWASVLLAAGQLAQDGGPDASGAEGWLDEAIATSQRVGRARTLAWSFFWRGRLFVTSSGLEGATPNLRARAKVDFEQALATFRTRNDALGIAWALYFLGVVAFEDDDDELYFSVSAELREFAATRAPELLGLSLARDAFESLSKGDRANALACIAAAEGRQREGDRFNLVQVLFDRAWIESQVGSRERALEALREALERNRRLRGDVEQFLPSIVVAALLVETGRSNEAREVLRVAGVVQGSGLIPVGTRFLRERIAVLAARLDFTAPATRQFANSTEATDWVLDWIGNQLENPSDDIEPANRVVDAAAAAALNIRPLPTTLIGRTDALAKINETVAQPGLVTLVGPGGIGKTRLLQEAGARFADRFERVWRIDLVAARDRAAVESALAEALLPARDPMMQSSVGGGGADVIAEVASRLADRRSLLALDNCEQLLDVVPEIVETLLQRAPTLTVLATSREPLAARGEVVIAVAPLELPADDMPVDPGRLQHVESVELLVTRARERGADVTITADTADDIASICRQLDGIPLGVELAAARLASTSVRDLAARLSRQLELLAGRGTDARHRTMRNAIDWSYELLEPGQRTLLRRLGIFVGGFTLDAAEEICSGEDQDDPLGASDAVYLNLAELVAKSLVVFDRERARYRLLEPVRQYADELLEESPEVFRLAARHARWALRSSREAFATQLLGNGAAADDFRGELNNVHAAIEWTFNHGDVATGLRIVAALGYVWFQTDWRRGRVIAERAAELARDAPMRLRAAVLLARGIVEQRADFKASVAWLTEARSLSLELGDDFSLAWATFFLGRAYEATSDNEAILRTQEAYARFESLDVPVGQAWALACLGALLNQSGRLDEARIALVQALEPAQRTGQNAIIGMVLGELGANALNRGDLDDARATIREALALYEHGGDQWNSIGLLTDAACVELAADQLGEAERLVRRALHTAMDVDDEFQLREALLLAAVIRSRHHDAEGARALLEASRFNVEDRERFLAREHSLVGRALRELDVGLDGIHTEQAHVGEKVPSSLEAARRFVSRDAAV